MAMFSSRNKKVNFAKLMLGTSQKLKNSKKKKELGTQQRLVAP
jgi:hypothetical protein